MIPTGIISAPRPNGQSYLFASLDSWYNSWDFDPVVFHEPGIPCKPFAEKIQYFENETTLGHTKNWLHALKILRLMHPAEPYYLLCEDDIFWQPNAAYELRARLKYSMSKDVGFISPYCSRVNHQFGETGWQRARMVSDISWCGALCLLLPFWAADYIIENEDYYLEKSNNLSHLDAPIGATLLKGNFHLLTHAPTLILHLGDISTFERNNRADANLFRDSRQPAL